MCMLLQFILPHNSRARMPHTPSQLGFSMVGSQRHSTCRVEITTSCHQIKPHLAVQNIWIIWHRPPPAAMTTGWHHIPTKQRFSNLAGNATQSNAAQPISPAGTKLIRLGAQSSTIGTDDKGCSVHCTVTPCFPPHR